MAWAANLSDPLLLSWFKPAHNPIIPRSPPGANHCPSFRDDSAAWRSRGERKMIASGCGAQLLYSSPDFRHWRYTGTLCDEGSECPSFWRLPNSSSARGGGATHVLKTGRFRLGTHDEGRQRFVPLPGHRGQPFPVQDGADGYSFDTYAGKDYVDGEARGRWHDWVQESTPRLCLPATRQLRAVDPRLLQQHTLARAEELGLDAEPPRCADLPA